MEILVNIILVLLALLVLAFLALKLYEAVKLKGLRKTVIDLIVIAENSFEYGLNNEKFNAVLRGVYNKFPEFIRSFISIDNVTCFIQIVFNEIKIALDNMPQK